ncbi:MAG: microcin ABC transporter permease, partial [Pseudomonadota bacterium]|nr:microcin ABC transporter permease [Pseudomonadota bacterium]
MFAYILRRLIFIIPTLLGILTINFFIIQAAPGGPVEQMIARLESTGESATVRVAGSDKAELMGRVVRSPGGGGSYRG